MELCYKPQSETLIVEVSGIVDRYAAGPLYDALVQAVRRGWTKVLVELLGVHHMTHAGVRGIIVVARLLRGEQGELRICGASKTAEAFLRGLGFNHLVNRDPTVEAALAVLSPVMGRKVKTPITTAGSQPRATSGMKVAPNKPSARRFGREGPTGTRVNSQPSALSDRPTAERNTRSWI